MSRGPLLLALPLLAIAAGCSRAQGPSDTTADGKTRLVFVHQPLWGAPEAFDQLLNEFRAANPDIDLQTQLLPNASDLAHQYFLTALEGGSRDFDVLVIDVVWVPEFAKAGWIADLSEPFPRAELQKDFLPGPLDAVTVDGKTWALPWYLDVGMLFYRKDLVPKAPTTYAELDAYAKAAMAKDKSLQGYLWQGRQYEGLVCNVYERIWGNGGQSLQGDRVSLNSEPAQVALAQLRALIDSGVSPSSVTSAAEEDSRRAFQDGRAVFMRNWPYAFGEAEKEGSPIRGKVAFAPLPTADGEPGFGTLGGWQLAVNAKSSDARKTAALKLLRHLTSREANLVLAVSYGRNPARRSVYEDAEVRQKEPFISELLPIMERSRPRPVTPYYGMLSDVLQSEFSSAVAGIRQPAEALQRAQLETDRITGAGQ